MSGVYIKGMEMPESCAECLNIGWQYVFECNLNDVESGARLGSCPLIPVPDHGRLVDADALEYHADNVRDPMGRTEKTVMWKKIEAAPTIIPADKEGEHD